MFESEKETRWKRVDPLLKAAGWTLVNFKQGLDFTELTRHAIREFPTEKRLRRIPATKCARNTTSVRAFEGSTSSGTRASSIAETVRLTCADEADASTTISVAHAESTLRRYTSYRERDSDWHLRRRRDSA